jgi:hypothetical protein
MRIQREIVLGLGRKKLGEPDAQVLSKIAGIREIDLLDNLLKRILDTQTWADQIASLDQ